MNFEAYFENQLHSITTNVSHYDMARDFELYYQGDNPFMTHMYGSDVFHWKTKNSSNVQYWRRLIEDIEGRVVEFLRNNRNEIIILAVLPLLFL